MKSKFASHALKILLTGFGFGVIFSGIVVLPSMANEMAMIYPQLLDAKFTILLISELLLLLLIVGIMIIMYLLSIFDKGDTYTFKFTRGLEILFVLCLIATLGVLILFYYLSAYGGPGPLIALVMAGVTFVILIVATVIMLVRAIVIESITYKTDYDLTV